jgi:hypothetical protein
MHMEETSPNVDDLAVTVKDDVRFTGEILSVQSKSITQPMNNCPHNFFGHGVAASYSRHIKASLVPGEYVSHPNF